MLLQAIAPLVLLHLSSVFAEDNSHQNNNNDHTYSQSPTATVKLCTQANFGGTCLDIPIPNSSPAAPCVNFRGGLTILNKEVTSVKVPLGSVCSFFEGFGCITVPDSDDPDNVVAPQGDWPDFKRIPGIEGVQDFDDKSSSMSCRKAE